LIGGCTQLFLTFFALSLFSFCQTLPSHSKFDPDIALLEKLSSFSSFNLTSNNALTCSLFSTYFYAFSVEDALCFLQLQYGSRFLWGKITCVLCNYPTARISSQYPRKWLFQNLLIIIIIKLAHNLNSAERAL